MSGDIGAHMKPKEPIEQVDTEGPLDQAFGLEIDGHMNEPVLLESVQNADDLFGRCPAIGELNLGKEIEGSSINSLLADDEYVRQDVFVDPNGDKLVPVGDAAGDRYSVADARWIDQPDELIWRSALLAQLQAKHVAITHFLNDPGAVDFGDSLSESERVAVATRARELAERLKDAALAEICAANHEANERYHASVSETAAHFRKYVVTREAEIEAGGLTEVELSALYPKE